VSGISAESSWVQPHRDTAQRRPGRFLSCRCSHGERTCRDRWSVGPGGPSSRGVAGWGGRGLPDGPGDPDRSRAPAASLRDGLWPTRDRPPSSSPPGLTAPTGGSGAGLEGGSDDCTRAPVWVPARRSPVPSCGGPGGPSPGLDVGGHPRPGRRTSRWVGRSCCTWRTGTPSTRCAARCARRTGSRTASTGPSTMSSPAPRPTEDHTSLARAQRRSSKEGGTSASRTG
jgi:hypothetical protein